MVSTGGRFGSSRDRSRDACIRLDATKWRRDQRMRKRRLTARGRTTVALLLTSLLAPFGWAAFAPLVEFGRGLGQAPEGVAVSAAPSVIEEVAMRVPERVLERLPVTQDVLEYAIPDASESLDRGRLSERVSFGVGEGPLKIEYTLDTELTEHVFHVLKRGRVALGNVVLMDPRSGRLLAYASTDPHEFPPTRTYPAASLVKVITAAAALESAPQVARLPCRFRGSPYRLTPTRIDPPEQGKEVSLQKALATSNNQCFAQLAVHAIGADPLVAAIQKFGWLDVPAPAHAAGEADPGEERFDVGRLGSGLAGARITPLHAVQLAATLVDGELVTPRWVERVFSDDGRELELPAPVASRRILSPELTTELRRMLIDTTKKGTARRAFRKKSGHPVLGAVAVAGKTGSLSGKAPDGRYEWFIGVAPADNPTIAVAAVVVQNHLWWRNASQIAAEVLRGVFCKQNDCAADNATRFVRRRVHEPPLAAARANDPPA